MRRILLPLLTAKLRRTLAAAMTFRFWTTAVHSRPERKVTMHRRTALKALGVVGVGAIGCAPGVLPEVVDSAANKTAAIQNDPALDFTQAQTELDRLAQLLADGRRGNNTSVLSATQTNEFEALLDSLEARASRLEAALEDIRGELQADIDDATGRTP